MNNKLIPIIVLTLAVGIILAGSVLVPVLNDATETEKTYTNSGYWYMSSDDSEPHTFEFVSGHTWIIDGVEYNTDTEDPSQLKTLISTGDMVMRNNGWANGNTSGFMGGTPTFAKFTIYNGKISGEYQNTSQAAHQTIDYDYDSIYFAQFTSDDNTLTKYNIGNIYLKDDSEIFCNGFSKINNTVVLIKIEGTITNLKLTIYNQYEGSDLTDTYEITDLTVNKVETDCKDLFKVSSITFTATPTGEETGTEVTYSSFIVPSEVTGELKEHLTPGQIALMGAIPVLVIVALLVVAVGVVARRNE